MLIYQPDLKDSKSNLGYLLLLSIFPFDVSMSRLLLANGEVIEQGKSKKSSLRMVRYQLPVGVTRGEADIRPWTRAPQVNALSQRLSSNNDRNDRNLPKLA